MERPHLVLLTYEFTFSSFSGNGILARSIVKALLQEGCRITVLCCRPSDSTNNNHIDKSEMEEAEHLKVFSIEIPEDIGWKRLDKESGWQLFALDQLDAPDKIEFDRTCQDADSILAIDWHGYHAFKSLSEVSCPLVYLNFRVYASGVSNEEDKRWYNDREAEALRSANTVIVLSQHDKKSLNRLVERSYLRLLPPLRGDIASLATECGSLDTRYLPFDSSLVERLPRLCLITCVVRLSPEKEALNFVQFIKQAKEILRERSIIPVLAGAIADKAYADKLVQELKEACPESIVLAGRFLGPNEMAAMYSRTLLNFHPCTYDAYGMTIVEAAAFGVPSIVSPNVGACHLLKDACFQEDLESTPGSQSYSRMINILRNETKIKSVGAHASAGALEWDETAYGKELLAAVLKTSN